MLFVNSFVTNSKLIHYYEIGEWELFDLTRDPEELPPEYRRPGTPGSTRSSALDAQGAHAGHM